MIDYRLAEITPFPCVCENENCHEYGFRVTYVDETEREFEIALDAKGLLDFEAVQLEFLRQHGRYLPDTDDWLVQMEVALQEPEQGLECEECQKRRAAAENN